VALEMMSQADAYRDAYDAENMMNKTIHEKASEVAAVDKVSARIKELREKQVDKSAVTLEECVNLIRRAAELAEQGKDISNLRMSGVDLAKVSGLTVEKHEVKTVDVSDKQKGIAARFAERIKK
jgi:hypothetical protein